MTPNSPLVSIIIPTLKLDRYITDHSLPSLANQTYKDFEVVILPNEKNAEDEELLIKYPWLRIIPTHNVTRPVGKRNLGVEYAEGGIIAFIDDDAFPSPIWLETAVRIFKEKKVAAVCGPGVLPKDCGVWECTFDEVLKTWLGSGGLSFRFQKEKARFLDDYPTMNFLITRKAFDEVGGFDSDYWPGEDSKLCEELVHKLKESIYYHPEVLVYHHRRNNLKGFLKQHAGYGLHRGAFWGQKDKNSTKLFYTAPTLFTLYLLTLIFIKTLSSTLQLLLITPLGLYTLLLLYTFTKVLINTKNLNIAVRVPLIIFMMHIVYGIYFVKGLVKRRNLYGR